MKTKFVFVLVFISSLSFAQGLPILENLELRAGLDYEFGMFNHNPEALVEWEGNPFSGSDVNPEQNFSPTYMFKPWVYIKYSRVGIGFSEFGNKLFDSVGAASKTEMEFKSGKSFGDVEGTTGNTEIALDWYIQESLALTATYLNMRYDAEPADAGEGSALLKQAVFNMTGNGVGIGIKTNNMINRRYSLRMMFMYYPTLSSEYIIDDDEDNKQSFDSYIYATRVNVDRKLVNGLWATVGLDWIHSSDNDKFVRNTRLMLDAGLYVAF